MNIEHPIGIKNKRSWRTRPDAYAEFWADICKELEADPAKEAKCVFQELQNHYPGRFGEGQLRTLQRRVFDWRKEIGVITSFEHWTSCLLQGKIGEGELGLAIEQKLGKQDVSVLLDCIRLRGIRSRNRAVAVLAKLTGIPISIVCRILKVERKTVLRYLHTFELEGVSGLMDFSKNIVKKADQQKYKDVLFAVLHEPPSLFGINRCRWEMDDLKRVMTQKGFPIALANIRQIIRNAGYKFRMARKVLTSNDPEYRQKLQQITSILSNLKPDEKFFSVDEFGPFSIKIVGGLSLMAPGELKSIPQYQKSKGTLILTAALELSTNQIAHFYSSAKNTVEMIRLLKVLLEKYADSRTIYFSWDAASWHASKALTQHVSDLNDLLLSGGRLGPRIELAPLPSCSQFLNIIESVFSGMARAIIHNSDYQSADAARAAIDRYFLERNQHFKENPKRAGNVIWGKERTNVVFSMSNNCKDPAYR